MRVAAIALLVFMCVDIGLDFVHGENGDTGPGDPGLVLVRSLAVAPEITSDVQSKTERNSSIHECFCCCNHLLLKLPAVVSVVLDSGPSLVSGSPYMPDPELIPVYHPPLYSI